LQILSTLSFVIIGDSYNYLGIDQLSRISDARAGSRNEKGAVAKSAPLFDSCRLCSFLRSAVAQLRHNHLPRLLDSALRCGIDSKSCKFLVQRIQRKRDRAEQVRFSMTTSSCAAYGVVSGNAAFRIVHHPVLTRRQSASTIKSKAHAVSRQSATICRKRCS